MNNYRTCTIQIIGCRPVSNYPVYEEALDGIYYATMILDINTINSFAMTEYIRKTISDSKNENITEYIKLNINNNYFRIFVIIERSLEEMLSISKRVNLETRMREVLKTLEYINEECITKYLGVLD